MKKLAIGDVVRLAIGGPPMTVEHVGQRATHLRPSALDGAEPSVVRAIGSERSAWCVWFQRCVEYSDVSQWHGPFRDEFDVNTLELVRPATTPGDIPALGGTGAGRAPRDVPEGSRDGDESRDHAGRRGGVSRVQPRSGRTSSMKRGATRIIDGHKYELAMWLQLETRADGIPLVLRLCQDGNTLEEELIAAGLCTKAEVDSGEAQARLKPTFQLMWTSSTWLVKERA